MPWFEGTHRETRTLPVAPEVARDHFADPAAIVAATKDVVRHEIEGRTLHFVLAEENHGVGRFQPDYRCVYEVHGDAVRWRPAGGNLEQSGEARFTPSADGCTLTYTETIRMDLGVPRLVVPMVRKLVATMIAREVRGYVDRMVTRLTTR